MNNFTTTFTSYLSDKIYEISSITDGEYIKICSSFNAMINQDFNCSTCLRKYKDKKRQEKMKKAKRCFVQSKEYFTNFHFKAFKMPTVLYKKCPGNYVSSYFKTLISEFSYFQKGVFAYPGTLNQQPAKFVEIMNLIDNLKRDHEFEMESKVNGRRR